MQAVKRLCHLRSAHIVLTSLLLLLSVASTKAAEFHPSDRQKVFERLQSGFQSRHWVVRAFTALRAGKNSDMQSLRVLLERFDNDSHERVKSFVLGAIARYPRDRLLLTLGDKKIRRIATLLETKNSYIKRNAKNILEKLFEKKMQASPRKWARQINSRGKRLKAERIARMKELKLTEEAVSPLPLPQRRMDKDGNANEFEDEQMGSVVPDGFGNFLRRLEKYGVYMCVLLDDTSSMDKVIDETRRRIWDILGIMQEITPKYHLAFVTYKDRVNMSFDFSSDGKDIFRFLKIVSAKGGGDEREGVDKALDFALRSPDITWNPKAVCTMVIMGDQPPHKKDEDKTIAFAEAALKRRIIINTIGTHRKGNGDAVDVPFFPEIAAAGGGEYSLLENVDDLLEEIILLGFGPENRDFIKPFVRVIVELRGLDRDE